jgi:hypothetical protein
MSEIRQKQVHLGNLGLTVAVLYKEHSVLCRVGVAVMSPIDRMAQQLTSPLGMDPWSMALGSRIALGRAKQLGRRRTMLRATVPVQDLERLLELLMDEDVALRQLLKVAKSLPSEQLFARLCGVARALRHVRGHGIPLGRTWDRRVALAFGSIAPAVGPLREVSDAAVCAGD